MLCSLAGKGGVWGWVGRGVVIDDQRWDGIGWLLDRGGVVVAWLVWSVGFCGVSRYYL